ncbi:MAG TPA: hypothetical protein VGM37_19575 [Armatimonadota bacterium]
MNYAPNGGFYYMPVGAAGASGFGSAGDEMMQEEAGSAGADPGVRAKGRRWRKLAYPAAVVVAILCVLTYMGVFWGNIRTVEPGEFYRSGQLRGERLVRVLRDDRIRSVINLRGRLPRDRAWQGEVAACSEMGVAHVDVSLSASRLPPPRELRALLTAYDRLPRPILIHCAGGADRSGLASTIYENVYRKQPLNAAETSQLTWRYGHIAFGSAHPMNDFFTMYRQTGQGLSLRDWVVRKYPALYIQAGGDPRKT